MEKQYYTIGMAGHIDHGKTTLTKALTNVDTDRLKEEKERQISIELGFAPLHLDDSMEVSVIDVPGHERFIRQMIAGVAGIDLVILVVAADEGVMPQTREHLEILSFLGITHGIVAISKIDRVDPEFIELVEDDVREQISGTVFQEAPMVLLDSLSHKGLDELRVTLTNELNAISKQKSMESFRLPIDQVFTVKGQGTVVRGTIYEGEVNENTPLTILPKNMDVKARQLQVHHLPVNRATAGQRVAINLAGVSKHEVTRGDVLVSANQYTTTDTIDVSLRFVSDLEHVIKQRGLIKCHIGTSEVMGKLVFFDRNEVEDEQDEVLCQLRLEQSIVTKRGDRFILRRPSPTETIGGGWVIDAQGQKYRFGEETVEMLKEKKEGTPLERLINLLRIHTVLSASQLIKGIAAPEPTVMKLVEGPTFVEVKKGFYSLKLVVDDVAQRIKDEVLEYHEKHSLRIGINKAEIVQGFSARYSKELVEYVIDSLLESEILQKKDQFLSIKEYIPSYPKQWAKRMEHIVTLLKGDGLHVIQWDEYVKKAGLPEKEAQELMHFLQNNQQIYRLDEKHMIHKEILDYSIEKLKAETEESFELKEAKDILGLSRKYLVPFLELLDHLSVTKRVDNSRVWNKL